ncbi:MAG: hypothetical protein K2X27_13650, partial [Candidatus Obscuribacterales bacterium]|nr:hypothetical protein [Candidatus Obscuribacterales bacterium]
MTAPFVSGQWSRNPDDAIKQATAEFSLRDLGWRGFEALDWVQKIKERFPQLARIANLASANNQYGMMLDELKEMLKSSNKLELQL